MSEQLTNHDRLYVQEGLGSVFKVAVLKTDRRGGMDIGTFGHHSGCPGVEWLQSDAKEPCVTEVQTVISSLGGSPGVGFKRSLATLSAKGLRNLREHADAGWAAEHRPEAEEVNDFKLVLTQEDLMLLIGADEVDKLLVAFGADPTEILLRRCQSTGCCINFHWTTR